MANKQYGLIFLHFDPVYSVEEINSRGIYSANNRSHPLFCTTPIIYQNVNNPPNILFCFSLKNMFV